MVDWDKLNKEFDDAMNNLTDEEWNDWFKNLKKQKLDEYRKLRKKWDNFK